MLHRGKAGGKLVGRRKSTQENKSRNERRGEKSRGEKAAGLGARGEEARATDQEPGSRGMEQVQAASEAFGPEGAARA